ncbi:MAG: M20 family metallopeptidase [Rhodospirillales bacterium]|nr:M20 family metallopeptidase [Rhodospirillales bacterium]
MELLEGIVALRDEMAAWRHDIHAHPETAFEEYRTAERVEEMLKAFGIETHRGLAGTGVVGTLGNGDGPIIGLRADLDALHIDEKTNLPYRSTSAGKMHACGHDGHIAMLLGAAKYLAGQRDIGGTVRFIFQPAEENEGGAGRMVADGLFEKFPVDAVYGLHNWPQAPLGTMAVGPGPMMAAYDIFEITVTGKGAHAAMPHQGVDPIVAASAIVGALQTVASRATDPQEAVVVTVTKIHGGDAFNVIPDTVTLGGTTRSFNPDVRDSIEPAIRRIVEGTCAAHGATAVVRYEKRYPPTINHPEQAEVAALAAERVVGGGNVDRAPVPSMGAEDFPIMLQHRPGAYAWLGTGRSESDPMLHNPRFDFNDDALSVGASYWVRLVESVLGKG